LKTLIIRTDRLGDFYLTLPFINALKRTFGEESTDIIVSENIYGHFKNKKYLFNNIFSYPKKNIVRISPIVEQKIKRRKLFLVLILY